MRGKRSDLTSPRYSDLTLRQGEVLDVIRQFVADHDHYPTQVEIGEKTGVGRVSTEMLEKLEAAGYLGLGRRRQGSARNIRLTVRGLNEPTKPGSSTHKGG